MKRHLLISLAAIVVAMCCVSVSFGAEVAQGKCAKVEKDGTVVTIEEYDTPASSNNGHSKANGGHVVDQLVEAVSALKKQGG